MQIADFMLSHLAADGPHPDHAEELRLFGQLTGSWIIEMTSIGPDGSRDQFDAEWHFGWVLDGRSVQDVLITRTTDGKVVGYGSTVRSFDPKRGLWWIVWQDPLAGEFAVLLARAEADRIVLDGTWNVGDPSRRFRWTFSGITPDRFRWEGSVLENGEWHVREEMQARRSPDGHF